MPYVYVPREVIFDESNDAFLEPSFDMLMGAAMVSKDNEIIGWRFLFDTPEECIPIMLAGGMSEVPLGIELEEVDISVEPMVRSGIWVSV
jgi:hypothetical protein